jgi:hypothetical protein
VWVNGHAFDFEENEISDGSYFVDKYVSSGMGCIHFSVNGEAKSFTGNCGLISVSGELSDPLVPVSGEGFVLAFAAPPSVAHIDRLWIRGTLYWRMGSGSQNFSPVPISEQPHTAAPVPSCTLTLGPNGQTWLLNGEDGLGTFSGAFQSSLAFLIYNHLDQMTVPVLRVGADGSAHLDAGTTLPTKLPACILVPPSGDFVAAKDPNTVGYSEEFIFRFAGLSTGLIGEGSQVALYLKINQKGHKRELLQLAVGGDDLRAATILKFDPAGVAGFSGGYFNTETLLFYRANTAESTFPLGVKPLQPQNSHAFLRHTQDPDADPLPPTFVIRGQGWHYAGLETVPNSSGQLVVVDIFHGPVLGQVMRVFPTVGQGSRLVTLEDPTDAAISSQTVGSLNPMRESITFRDGTVALRGNELGLQHRVQMADQLNVHTIQGDLDVLGNHLSFGLLHNDAGLAGALFRFTDQPLGDLSRLESTLGRNHAEWSWSKAGALQGGPADQVMHLTTDHRLIIRPSLLPGQSAAPIILNPTPNGVSSIPGVLRVRKGGDLSMGQYQAGGQP